MPTATVEPLFVSDSPASEAAPEIPDDAHYEVLDGRRVETPRMGVYEIRIASTLIQLLGPYVRERGLGRVDTEMLFLIDPARNLQRRPDLAFVSRARWPLDRKVPRTAAWDVVPDLAVEVVSPSNSASGVVVKLTDYFRAGVGLVWVVYPLEDQVHVWESPSGSRVLTRGDVLDGGAAVPGFRLPLDELFEPA